MEMISPYVWVGMIDRPDKKKKISVDQIVLSVCNEFQTTREEISKRSRRREIVQPRQIAMYLIKQILPAVSLKKIGETFGSYDHTTVLHSCQTVQNLMDSDKNYERQVTHLFNSIKY